ncbi:MAG: molybdenum cofactor guanylyltransferase MobA [Pseudomonadota bacterium]
MAPVAAGDMTGVILAGGRGQRLGGADKGLVQLAGKPLIEYVIAALQPQVGCLVISANRNREIYAAYGFPVIADTVGEYYGPLAGMLSALRAAPTPYILTAPCDAPALPADLAGRLSAALVRKNAQACVAVCDGRMQPVFALLRRALADDLQKYLECGGRGAGAWMHAQRAATADFSDQAQAFANINTPQALAALAQRFGRHQGG